MRKSTTLSFFLLWILLTMFSCNTSSDPIDIDNPNIRGSVINPDGQPVENAIIVLNFKVNTLTKTALDAILTNITIQFSVPSAGHVHLWISKMNSTDLLTTLLDEELLPGIYQVMWDGTNKDGQYVVSGVYTYHLELPSDSLEANIIFLRTYSVSDSIHTLAYYAKTDKDGRFEIDQSELPFEYQFEQKDQNGNMIGSSEISRLITIWALQENYGLAALSNINVDPRSGAEITLQFQ
jgi:hypothetical protein